MPADYRIDSTEGVIYSRAWGTVTDRDLIDNRDGMLRDGSFDRNHRQLYDLTGVINVEVTAAAVRTLAQSSPFPPDAVRAIAVSSDVVFGMVRMYAILGDRDEARFRIFRDRDEALAWLLDQ